jgi:hypothetical protein
LHPPLPFSSPPLQNIPTGSQRQKREREEEGSEEEEDEGKKKGNKGRDSSYFKPNWAIGLLTPFHPTAINRSSTEGKRDHFYYYTHTPANRRSVGRLLKKWPNSQPVQNLMEQDFFKDKKITLSDYDFKGPQDPWENNMNDFFQSTIGKFTLQKRL